MVFNSSFIAFKVKILFALEREKQQSGANFLWTWLQARNSGIEISTYNWSFFKRKTATFLNTELPHKPPIIAILMSNHGIWTKSRYSRRFMNLWLSYSPRYCQVVLEFNFYPVLHMLLIFLWNFSFCFAFSCNFSSNFLLGTFHLSIWSLELFDLSLCRCCSRYELSIHLKRDDSL